MSFIKQPMANPCPNLQCSGIPDGSQRATATQEIMRRLKNTTREAPELVPRILTEYMGELAQGGYPLSWRKQVLSAAIRGYVKIWNLETKGEGFVNRPDHVTKDKRRAAKLNGSSTWFQKPRGPKTGPKPTFAKGKKRPNIPHKTKSILFEENPNRRR